MGEIVSSLHLSTGSRGTLVRDMRHTMYDMKVVKKGREFKCECWFGKGQDAACIKTVCSHVANMITGVTLVCSHLQWLHGDAR